MHSTLLPAALSVPEAARFIGIGTSTLWRLIARGEINPIRIGRSTRVCRDDLNRWLATRPRWAANDAGQNAITR
jgi:excisionase family DNA binding protein